MCKVNFIAKFVAGREFIDARVNGELRFKVESCEDFRGGWEVFSTMHHAHCGHFESLAAISEWIEELDK